MQLPGLVLLLVFLARLHWRRGGFGGRGDSLPFSAFFGLSGVATAAYLVPSVAVYVPWPSMVVRRSYYLFREDVGDLPVAMLFLGYGLVICGLCYLLYGRLQNARTDAPVETEAT